MWTQLAITEHEVAESPDKIQWDTTPAHNPQDIIPTDITYLDKVGQIIIPKAKIPRKKVDKSLQQNVAVFD